MVYSTKIAIKTTVVLGLTILAGATSAWAQVPQDPYPQFLQAQSPAVQDRATQGSFSQGSFSQGPAGQPSVSPTASSYHPLGSRSERLERIAQDADRHTQKAFQLASRGAHYSSRAEFVRALRLVSQGLDSERQCRVYSESLRAGLKALEEVDDFIPTGSQLEIDLPLREIIARHQTTVLKESLIKPEEPTNSEDWSERSAAFSPLSAPLLPTPMEAVGAYLHYAEEQLSIAVGGEVAGSMALHGLGKLYTAQQGTELDIAMSRAMVCFRASTTVCPQNYLAQNDLGVLLARTGRTSDACQIFEKSLTIHPHPTTMANLAAIYHALGKKDSVDEMRRHLAAYRQSPSAKSELLPAVDWVSPEKFSESYAKMPDARQLPPVRRPSDPKVEPPVKQADRSWPWNWIKR